MRCPACDRDTPDALLVCRHCGGSTRPSLLRRLFRWLRPPSASVSIGRPPVTADEEQAGIEMPAMGVKAISVTVSDATTRAGGIIPSDALAPDVVEQLRRAAAGGGQVYYERVTEQDGLTGKTTVSERGTPLDPDVRAAVEQLLASHADGADTGTTHERQIVVETNGTRKVYASIDEVPPEVRCMLGKFADLPINRDATDK